MDRQALTEAALIRLTPDEFDAEGKPSLDAVNAHFEGTEFEPLTAEELEAIWSEREAEAAVAGPMAAELVLEPTEEGELVLDAPEPATEPDFEPEPEADLPGLPGASPDPDPAPEAEPETIDAVTTDPDDTIVEVKLISAPAEPLPLYVHGIGRFTLRAGNTYRLPAEAVSALRNSDCKIEVASDED